MVLVGMYVCEKRIRAMNTGKLSIYMAIPMHESKILASTIFHYLVLAPVIFPALLSRDINFPLYKQSGCLLLPIFRRKLNIYFKMVLG